MKARAFFPLNAARVHAVFTHNSRLAVQWDDDFV
jgi:hypothetical protein